MDIPRFLRAMAKLVEDHTEEFAACFNGASAGTGVKDDPAPKSEPAPFKLGDNVHVTVQMPMWAHSVAWIGKVVDGRGDHITLVNENALLRKSCAFNRDNGRWTSPEYDGAISLVLEHAS